MRKPSRTIEDPLTGQLLTFTETSAETGGTSLRAEVHLEPGGFVPRHLHLRQDEVVTVLSGAIRLRTQGRDRMLGVGETAVVTRRHVHRVTNTGPGAATFVLDVRPARHIEQTIRSTFALGRIVAPLLAGVGRRNRPPAPT